MVEVALSGNLDFVPLEEVLRLLTRAERSGAVNVSGEQARGRIFISKQGIALATTADDATLRSHLVNSGYVDDAYLDGVEAGETSLAPLGEDLDGGITALLREMTIESIYQLSHNGDAFEVMEDTESPFSSPSPFDLELVLEDAQRRSDEWEEVSRIVSDLNSPIKMSRDIGDRDSVEISREAWKLLSELGSGASVNTVAGRLGTTEFWTAKVAADMAEKELLIVAADYAPADEAAEPEWAQSVTESDPDESWWQEPEGETPDADADADADEVETAEAPAIEEEAEVEVEVEVAEATQPDESEGSRFFGQFAPKPGKKTAREEVAETQDPPVQTDEPAFETVAGSDDESSEEVIEERAAAATETTEDAPPPVEVGSLDNVQEDTEAFLEKVFSELESNGQPDDEEGHGLLRRRRMGSVLRELDED